MSAETYNAPVSSREDLQDAISESFNEVCEQRGMESFKDITPVMRAFMVAGIKAEQ